MSRQENISDNMLAININEPSRLKLNFGKPSKTNKLLTLEEEPQIQPQPTTNKEVVIEIIKNNYSTTEVNGWYIPAGYVIFLICMALSNILSLPNLRQENYIPPKTICTLLSPLPMASLAASSLSSRFPCLHLIAACLIPIQCSLWSMYAFMPYAVFLGSALMITSKRTTVLSGTFTCLLLSMIPNPKWGAIPTLFCLCILCVLSSMAATKIAYKIKNAL